MRLPPVSPHHTHVPSRLPPHSLSRSPSRSLLRALVLSLFVFSLPTGCAEANLGAPASTSGGASEGGGGEASGDGAFSANEGSGAASQANSGASTDPATDSGGGGAQNAGSSGGGDQSAGSETSTEPSEPTQPGKATGDDGTSSTQPNAGDAAGSTATCDTTKPVIRYLSADDSNSMAGATIARGLIEQGQYVYKGLRTYEFLNYYDFDYAPASAGKLAVSAQLRAAPAVDTTPAPAGTYHLQIGVRAPNLTAQSRRAAHIVLAVDTSSSMGWGPAGNTGLDRAQAACVALASSLRAGDHISLVAWGRKAQELLSFHAVTKTNDPVLLSQCGKLEANGTTGLSVGLLAAYNLAAKHFSAKQMNRVVLISDGGTNVGEQDAKLIGDWAKKADGKAITLMGVGVGDPWNYNDTLMNTVTDAGKGAYVFFDDSNEAQRTFGDAFLRHMEVAARNVRVQLTLPPGFDVAAFYGEQISANKKDVEPQHLAANDAMIFNQVSKTCAPKGVTGDEKIAVTASWIDPISGQAQQATTEKTLAELLGGDALLLQKGDAIVAYVETLKALRTAPPKAGGALIEAALKIVAGARKLLPKDVDLQEIAGLLSQHKQVYSEGQADLYPTGGTGAKALTGSSCGACAGLKDGSEASLPAMACALDLCDSDVLLGHSYTSPTGSTTKGTFAATTRYGSAKNDLAPKVGGSYAVMATGPALGTAHSKNMGGKALPDPFSKGSKMFNAMEFSVKLKAPKNAQGFRLQHVFFSEEYDEYVGSKFNDKFYIVLQAGSTNGGKPTVINFTKCRDPDKRFDFVCSPGMQFCNPRQRYCYIAINTAVSECCWIGGCPDGTAKTDISGTGFSCGSKGSDSANTGSSTGWLTTEWPIEPGEIFTLTFHVHDTGDGIYDSAVLLDGLQFVESVTPGTWATNTL